MKRRLSGGRLMRKELIKTAFVVLLLLAVMTPLAGRLSLIQADMRANDAEHMVEPMLRLYAANPADCADVPVAPMMDIEQIWEIEDTRTEAEEPLVIGMRNGGSILGYDEESRTFYCTIGGELSDDAWPELDLYVQGRDGSGQLAAVFVDDYSYDYPSDSVSMGYRYELMAYTEKEYQYFGIVYTSLPIVTLRAETEIGNEYVPAFMSVSSAQHEPIVSMAHVHERGGGYVLREGKYSYRVEFQQIGSSGRSKARDLSVLGMEPDSDWLLIANAKDQRCVQNHLAFKLWNKWASDEHAFMKLETHMVEVFVDNEYKGLFQLMQRHDTEKEIERNGGSLDTDCCVRLISPKNESDMPTWNISATTVSWAECRYAPGGNARRAFDLFADYCRLNEWLDEDRLTDEAFTRVAERCVDVESFMSYFLFHLMVGLTDDNIGNNVFFYILNEDGDMRIHMAPWDMDWAFFYGYFGEEITSPNRFDLTVTALVRMLDLNVMNCREVIHRMYRELRETVISEDGVESWIGAVEQEIGMSGAYQRDGEKWRDEPTDFSLQDMLEFEKDQAWLIGDLLEKRWPLEPGR